MLPDFMLNRVSNKPKLSWLGAKMHKQSNLGRKNNSGHNTEWSEALIELDMVMAEPKNLYDCTLSTDVKSPRITAR